jgi:hypothetical protein
MSGTTIEESSSSKFSPFSMRLNTFPTSLLKIDFSI